MAESEGRLVYRGFEAWVVVDKKPLPHFGVECKESTREVSAWIPSEVGQRFKICYRKAEGDKRAFTATLYLDGQKFFAKTYSKRRTRPFTIRTASSIEISPTEIRDFAFNSAMLTDDDAYVDHPSSAGIGEIKLVFRTVEVTHKHPPTPRFIPAELLETPKIHERSKKGLVHQIQFSESKTRPYFIRGSSSTKTVGSRRIFIFKYRSLDLLQANGIAPCPTPPAEAIEDVGRSTEKQSSGSILEPGTSNVKREGEDDEGDDDEDEIIKARALLAKLEERRNQKRARKEIGRSSNKVKKEFASSFQPGEVIDLTEPDEIRPKKRVKNESTSQFALGDVIDLT